MWGTWEWVLCSGSSCPGFSKQTLAFVKECVLKCSDVMFMVDWGDLGVSAKETAVDSVRLGRFCELASLCPSPTMGKWEANGKIFRPLQFLIAEPSAFQRPILCSPSVTNQYVVLPNMTSMWLSHMGLIMWVGHSELASILLKDTRSLITSLDVVAMSNCYGSF